MANEETAVAVVDGETDAKPKTLGKLEKIVESNVARGAGLWRIAADALLEIRDRKLWRKAKDESGNTYPNFTTYAEARFGFKKTYAYDLVKAARNRPEALTEGEARESMKVEREPSPLAAHEAAARIDKAWTSFEDRAGNLRDRAIEDAAFVKAYDKLMREMGTSVRAFVAKYPAPIEGEATEANPDNVQPTREAEAEEAKA